MKPTVPAQSNPLSKEFTMNRNLISIAIAAAATFGAASSFAADMPAAGEFSGVEQVTAPFTAHLRTQPRATYNMAANGQPAAGEFSAADDRLAAGPSLSREAVRQALADANSAQPVVNGEIPESYAATTSSRTRQEVRQEGRMATRSGTMAVGELNM